MVAATISTAEQFYGKFEELTYTFLSHNHKTLAKPATTIAKEIGRAPQTVRRALKYFGLRIVKTSTKRMALRRNLKGNKYGKLTVESRSERESEADIWICRCQCGRQHTTTGYKLINMMIDECTVCSQPKSVHGKIPAVMWAEIKRGGAKRRRKFEVTIEEASALFDNQREKCALSGVSISFAETCSGHKRRRETTASLDRIDSKKGYVSGNIQWVHKTVNLMKQKLTQSEFINWCRLIAETNK